MPTWMTPQTSALLHTLQQQKPLLWFNTHLNSPPLLSLPDSAIDEAAARLARFAPYLAQVFPETAAAGGLIESPLQPVAAMQTCLQRDFRLPETGRLYLKMDSHLPISGSIKARGGIYEVLKHAEQLACMAGETDFAADRLPEHLDYRVLAEPRFRSWFSQYRIAVGSTGNLGLSIGIISAALGFAVTVHMSADARPWKKALLRQHGVEVIEYPSDYEQAVAAGRAAAAADPRCHFVDDEHSQDLFLGYAVAAKRLQAQLQAASVPVDAEHPLFVYLPCGVGGGPGGVYYGLKQIFGEHVHGVFAEPTAAPCMLLAIATQQHEAIGIGDIGLDGHTAADGLAVGRASGLVSRLMSNRLDALATVADADLYRDLVRLYDSEQIFIEPSACAGFAAYRMLLQSAEGQQRHALAQATHIVWATGGNMVPETERQTYLALGRG